MARQGLLESGNEIRRQSRFCYVTQRSFGDACLQERRFLVNRQKHEFGPRTYPVQFMRGIHPIQYWHGDIQNNHVGVQPLRFRNQVISVVCSANHVILRTQKCEHSVEHQLVIVCH